MKAPSFRWTTSVLALRYQQYEQYEASTAGTLPHDADAGDLVIAGLPRGMLARQGGGTPIASLLTLRVGPPIDEARHKVRRNSAMREGRA